LAKTQFENLQVYKEAVLLADFIWDEVAKWHYFEKKTIGIQITRSADSIAANLAEGYGKESFAERRRFALISQGSLFETKHWLIRIKVRALLNREQIDRLLKDVDRLLALNKAYINYLTRQKNSSKKRA